jgi:hypothetical protein
MDCDPPFYTYYIAGMTGACHHIQVLVVEIVLVNFLPRLAWISASQVARMAGVSNWAQLDSAFLRSCQVMVRLWFADPTSVTRPH